MMGPTSTTLEERRGKLEHTVISSMPFKRSVVWGDSSEVELCADGGMVKVRKPVRG